MHMAIDILAAIILLFFLLAGWHKGTLLSVLGVVRALLAYSMAYFTGRYVGFWLGEVAHRPRIVTIPMVAGLTFVIISFVFHIVMTNIRDTHLHKAEKEDFKLPWHSCLGGAAINGAVGLFSMILIFWLGDIFMVGVTTHGIPGADKSNFGRFTRRAVYEATYIAGAREGRESQAAAFARVISNPAKGMTHLKNVLAADSVQQILKDKQFAEDLLSGDAARIEQNASLQQLFNDRDTLDELREIGVLSGKEKKSVLCERLSRFGRNENIRTSMENLKTKKLLSTDQIAYLIRDPDFDVVVAELLK